MSEKQEALLLVDIDSLYYCTRQKFGKKVNYSKLVEQIKKDFHITRAIAYGKNNDSIDLSGFIGVLDFLGFETKFLDPHYSNIELCVDVFKSIDRLEQVILISSRKCFVP